MQTTSSALISYRSMKVGDTGMATFKSGEKEIFYSADRKEWRQWLESNFRDAKEIWFAFPMKSSG